MDNNKKHSKILIFFVVALCLAVRLFVILLLIPDSWLENSSEGGSEYTSESTSDGKNSDKDTSVKKIRDKADIKTTGIVRKPNVELQGGGEDSVTMLIYMNGSNLETDDSEGSIDLSEIVSAGSSDKVNVIVQTMGTKKWHDYGIASNRSQIYSVDGDGLTLIKDDLGQLDCTKEQTLSDFIKWGVKNYPADRYILQFWNHGGGPVYGFGYDEWNADENATLTIDEMQSALKDAGTFFDFIGMDCCIMASLETCCALYDYCDYLIVSEDFESGLGWSYEGMMSKLYENSSTPTVDLAKIAIDDTVAANEKSKEWGDSTILTLVDESVMRVVFKAWKDFAFANADTLIGSNYSRKIIRSKRSHPALNKGLLSDYIFDGWSYDAGSDNPEMSDYYITDIMSVAENIDSEESKALSAAISEAIVYSNSTADDASLTGLSVTLPYGDGEFYAQLEDVFTNVGIDDEYVDWLKNFVDESATNDFYDYDSWEEDWSGWDDYDEEYDWSDWSDEEDSDWWSDDSWWLDDNYSYDDYDDYYYDDYYYDDYDDDYYYGDDDYNDGYFWDDFGWWN